MKYPWRKAIHKTIFTCTCCAFLAAGSVLYVDATEGTVPPATEQPPVKTELVSSFIENYNAEFALFEESLVNLYYVYSNVGNGSFTTKPVKIDIPANLRYTLEKDGAPIEYNANEEISAVGNYVLRVEAEEDAYIYIATFRFSIRKEQERVEEPVEEVPVELQDPSENPAESEEPLSTEKASTPEDSSETVEEGSESTEKQEPVITVGSTRTLDSYLNLGGQYECDLATGEVYYSSVPNGAIVNESFTVGVSETLNIKAYLNDEEIEPQDIYEEEGSYRFLISGSSAAYIENYGTTKFALTFRIVKSPISDLQYLYAPKGFVITAISKDNKDLELGENYSAYYKITEDGKYAFICSNPVSQEMLKFSIDRDTVAPSFSISIRNGKATIEYLSDDIKEILVWKDGEPIELSNVTTIIGKGTYTIRTIDMAGNMKEGTFVLKKSVNGATIIAVLIILLMAGGFFYVVRSNKQSMNVR